VDRESILDIVFRAIDAVNELRSGSEQVTKAPNVALTGANGALDSLALVTLILSIESLMSDTTGISIDLLDSDFGEDCERLRSPEAIVELILERLTE
jgi:acyl carrier protein